MKDEKWSLLEIFSVLPTLPQEQSSAKSTARAVLWGPTGEAGAQANWRSAPPEGRHSAYLIADGRFYFQTRTK